MSTKSPVPVPSAAPTLTPGLATANTTTRPSSIAQLTGCKFFLSHKWGKNQENHKKVLAIYEQLITMGIDKRNIWIDEQELIGGDNFYNEITNAIIESNIFILFVTKDYMDAFNSGKRNDMCWFELTTANMKDKKILPILMDETIKDFRTWSGAFEPLIRNTLNLDFTLPEIFSNSNQRLLEERCENILICSLRLYKNHQSSSSILDQIIPENDSFKFCTKCKNGRICEMFDRTEHITICTPCAMSELRKDHSKVTIEEEVDLLRKDNHQPTIDSLKSSLEELEKLKKNFQENIQTMKVQRTLKETEITTMFDFFRKVLDRKEEELKKSCLLPIHEIDSFYEKEFHFIQEKSNEIAKLLENLEICFLSFPGQQIYYTAMMVQSAQELLKLKESLKQLISKKELKKKEDIDWDVIGEDLKKFLRSDGYMELFETGYTCQWQLRNPAISIPVATTNQPSNNNNNNPAPQNAKNAPVAPAPVAADGKVKGPTTATTTTASTTTTPTPTDMFQNKRFLTIPRKVMLLRTLIAALASGVDRIRSLKFQEKSSWTMENCESLIPDLAHPTNAIGYQVSIDGLPHHNKSKRDGPANLTVHLNPSVVTDSSRVCRLSQYFHQNDQLKILLDRESKVSRFSFPLLCGGIQSSPLIYLWIQSAKGGDLSYQLVETKTNFSIQKHQFSCREFMISFDIQTPVTSKDNNNQNKNKKAVSAPTADTKEPKKSDSVAAATPVAVAPSAGQKKSTTPGSNSVTPPPAPVVAAPPAKKETAAPPTVTSIPDSSLPASAATVSLPVLPVAAPPAPSTAKKTPAAPAAKPEPSPPSPVPAAAAAPGPAENDSKLVMKLPRSSWNRFILLVQQETDADGHTGWKLCLSINEQFKLIKVPIQLTNASQFFFSLTAQQKDVSVKIDKFFISKHSSAFLKNRNLFQPRTFEVSLEKEKKDLTMALFTQDFLEDFNKLF